MAIYDPKLELCYNPNMNGILVYNTLSAAHSQSGTQIGLLYSKESFVILELHTNEWGSRACKIEFVNSSGSWVVGYIQFNGANIKHWHQNPEATVNGNPRYKVAKTTTVYNGSKGVVATLSAGDYIYSRPGTSKVGTSEHDWIKCFAYKKDGVYKEPGYDLYADTKVKHGSTSPCIKGNW